MPFATFLITHGYELAFRRDGFVEVLATRGHERFTGRGVSDDDALSDLMRCMFPSAASRTLLDAELALTRESPPRDADPPVAAGTVETSGTPGAADVPALSLVETAPDTAPPSLDEPAHEQLPGAPVSAPPAPAPAPAVAFAPATPRGPSDEDVREAVEACEDILAEIEERLDELSRAAPESQRLLMLSFICRARAEVEEVQRVEVHQATARVAKRLSDLAKLLWPGSVRALQLGVTPSVAAAARPWLQSAAYVGRRCCCGRAPDC